MSGATFTPLSDAYLISQKHFKFNMSQSKSIIFLNLGLYRSLSGWMAPLFINSQKLWNHSCYTFRHPGCPVPPQVWCVLPPHISLKCIYFSPSTLAPLFLPGLLTSTQHNSPLAIPIIAYSHQFFPPFQPFFFNLNPGIFHTPAFHRGFEHSLTCAYCLGGSSCSPCWLT